jgi:hypothetical protein
VLALLTLLIALLACKKEESGGAGATCSSDGDCKNGFLCESSACIPKEAAEKIRGTAQAATATATPTAAQPGSPAAEGKASEPEAKAGAADEGPIPAIPEDKSSPPTVAEWARAVEVNTQEKNSQPDKCEMKVMREWLRVSCHGDVVGYEKMENFGTKNGDYFEMIKPDNLASFVVRLKRGKTQSVRICRKKDRASLFVNWPASKDRPVHVALGRGPVCGV